MADNADSGAGEPEVKKGRGRPKKADVVKEETKQAEKRGRGRTAVHSSPKKKRMNPNLLQQVVVEEQGVGVEEDDQRRQVLTIISNFKVGTVYAVLEQSVRFTDVPLTRTVQCPDQGWAQILSGQNSCPERTAYTVLYYDMLVVQATKQLEEDENDDDDEEEDDDSKGDSEDASGGSADEVKDGKK
uniref:Uncharacterized protein n=1 Tax=Strigamia maritima TaxID=126957 RepID=T1IZK2_STRMM